MKSIMRLMILVSSLAAILILARCGGSHQTVPPLTITPASLPNGTAGTSYSQNLQASGGVAPFHWTVSAGSLPHSLQLIPTGLNSATISGTPDTIAQQVTFTVKVSDQAGQSATQSYTLSILGQPDTVTLSPANLSFNPQPVGTASVSQSSMLTNTGSSPVAINNVAPTGTNASDFSESSTCASSLGPECDCVIHVTFTPSQPGPRVGSIAITDDTVNNPHQLPLSGIGLTSGPNATLSATELNFGNQSVGTAGRPLSITLSNYGATTLNIADIATTTNFAETNSCEGSLASGASCTINLTFTPSTTGSITGTLSITDNAADSPQMIALNGAGVQPPPPTCLPQGAGCYGPGSEKCCAAPRPHHAFCSNPTGWGNCAES
jgi:hypothetical protein